MSPSFARLFFLLNVLAIVSTGITVYWGKVFAGGFSLTERGGRLSWHRLLMSIGLLFLYGNGVLAFKILEQRNVSRQVIKAVHALLNFIGGIFAILGLVVVFLSHTGPGIGNLYSLHSWVGVITVVLYELNYALGLVCFFLPQTPGWIRGLYKPYHVFVGQALIGLISVSFITGIVEKAMFLNFKNGMQYADLPSQAIMINAFGLIIVAVGIVKLYLVTKKG